MIFTRADMLEMLIIGIGVGFYLGLLIARMATWFKGRKGK